MRPPARLLGAVLLAIGASLMGVAPPAQASTVQNPAAAPLVSFTFDDGLSSISTDAAPTLAKYGLTGTSFVIAGCVGMTTAPNTCRANTDATYMTWDQITAVQNSYHWEIGSHTATHPCLASNSTVDPDDCQRSTLTQAQLDTELGGSKTTLASHGINATAFAPPYGDYSNTVLATAAKYYTSLRGFKEQGLNQWPLDDYLLSNKTVQETTDTVASLEAQVDAAIAQKRWLILTFHDIKATPSTNPDDYEFGTAELDQLAAYVKAKQDAGLIRSVTQSQGLATSDTDLLPNGTFNDGIADGWRTDDPVGITKDTASHGSAPDPTNAIKLVSKVGGGNSHLFSPAVAVNPASTYLLKNFLVVQAITSGEVAFYVDEYDAAGNWISGQYLKRENSAFVEDLNFPYKPTSTRVASASLQVIVAGTGITAYLDNAQLFALDAAPVTHPNLVANGTFDAGIANGWTTDAPAGIVADAGGHGSPANPVNAVAFTAGVSNTHLFSPKVAVSSSNTYTLTSWLDLVGLSSGEVAFYVDEYDAAGNWISGQYKTGVHTLGSGDVALTYSPTSASVATASLQVIVVGSSSITGYVDDVRWWQN